MKYLNFLIILIILSGIFCCTASTDAEIKLIANGKTIECEVPPVIRDSRTLVPIRAVAEASNAEVSWNERKRQVYIMSGDTEIYLTIDSKTATVDGKKVTLDVESTIIDGRTMVPVRFVAETFGYNVAWNGTERIVSLTSINTKTVTLNTIGAANVEGGFRVTIKFNSPMQGSYNIMELSNPVRVVVDIEKAQIDYSRQFDFDNATVKDARAANHDDYLRVTLDLEKSAKYKTYVNAANDALVLIFAVETNGAVTTDNKDDEKPQKPEKNGVKTIVIDAGHGGSDPGALGKDEEGETLAREADVNLDVAKKTAAILEEAGYNVVTTRTSDKTVTLSGRCQISNDADADLFVSIHSNAMDAGREDVNGTMVFYGAKKDKDEPWVLSKTLASNILRYLCDALDTENLGIQVGDELAVIRGTEAPAVLVELAFITNSDDREKLMSSKYRQKAAQAIADGIIKTIK